MRLSLDDYLIKLLLPTSPALLDAAELSRDHRRHARAREHALNDIDDLYGQHRAELASVPIEAGRQLQDAAFLLRRSGPRVPSFFYRLRRSSSAADTAAGATELRRGSSS